MLKFFSINYFSTIFKVIYLCLIANALCDVYSVPDE